ncbi:hypothetical protein MCOR27_000598 [Pyricularia oryzae]|uniref:Uncharacterized protein n=1 Tax=Pyricularia grisea TaxID=148305 RepID=A0ABQ8NKQ7_PYRGI|nr:hypothetical protein MCOR01_005525 [Pyricularia oryzae]KAI6298483.1 hypothetical protein MCOR33_005376 [Pyricularia grisea]KAI6257218.1 hypothetical protein MCOR19_006348 [Pyricularia oryzae]KAI6280381.1 hypothetical protein MCOR26_003797 [Pyricularia oryzae]KAI6289029.1 hypothetical protein MCOR27_000598 [Pyricularia oryzae]
MASETPEKSVAGNLALNGLKPKDMEVLSLMVLCSTPEAHANLLSNINFEQFASLGSYKNEHAAKTVVGMLIRKLKANTTPPDNANALTPTATPKKRKTPVKKAANNDDDGEADTPAKKPRARTKKAASAEPVSKDVEMRDQGEVQTE